MPSQGKSEELFGLDKFDSVTVKSRAIRLASESYPAVMVRVWELAENPSGHATAKRILQVLKQRYKSFHVAKIVKIHLIQGGKSLLRWAPRLPITGNISEWLDCPRKICMYRRRGR